MTRLSPYSKYNPHHKRAKDQQQRQRTTALESSWRMLSYLALKKIRDLLLAIGIDRLRRGAILEKIGCMALLLRSAGTIVLSNVVQRFGAK